MAYNGYNTCTEILFFSRYNIIYIYRIDNWEYRILFEWHSSSIQNIPTLYSFSYNNIQIQNVKCYWLSINT